MPRGTESPEAFELPQKNAQMSDYLRVMESRPLKFNQEAVNYGPARDGEPTCDGCMHFYTRQLDKWHVCEILRPIPEVSIEPKWTCDFQTANGEDFPLYREDTK